MGTTKSCAPQTANAFERFFTEAIGEYTPAWIRIYKELISTSVVKEKALPPAFVQEFRKHNIDLENDIWPVVKAFFMKFITTVARRKARREITTKVRTRLSRYRQSVYLLTEDTAPFPDDIKEALRMYWQYLDRYPLEAKIHEVMWEESKDDHLLLSGTNFKKSMHKHPGWKTLEQWLFERFTEKGLSKGKAYHLIVLLVETLLPHDFNAAYKTDTIRQRVKTPAK